MHTVLDHHSEIQLDGYSYDGTKLVAVVTELVVGPGGKVAPGPAQYQVTFESPVAHAVTEEFPAILAEWLQGEDTGHLRLLENPRLAEALGMTVESFISLHAFALVSAHEVLVVFSAKEPRITSLNA